MTTTLRDRIDWRVHRSQAWDGSEHDLQVHVVNRAMLLAKTRPEILLIHAIPNGNWRGQRVAAKLKAEGVRPGVADLFLPVARGGFHGLYMELKRAGGCPSCAQWEFLEAVTMEGYMAVVTNSLSVAESIIFDYVSNDAKSAATGSERNDHE
jgi:hypothetical protein